MIKDTVNKSRSKVCPLGIYKTVNMINQINYEYKVQLLTSAVKPGQDQPAGGFPNNGGLITNSVDINDIVLPLEIL